MIDISTSQIKSVAPFPPVIDDLISVGRSWTITTWTVCPICPSKRGDNEFKSTGPQFATGIVYLTCYITTTWEREFNIIRNSLGVLNEEFAL